MICQTSGAIRPRFKARFTKGCRLVLLALESLEKLWSAQQIHAWLRQNMPDDAPGLATVYRSLALLVARGVVQCVPLLDGERYYEVVNVGEHHHHLVCSTCKKSVHLEQCVIQELQTSIGNRYGFVIDSHILELLGKCSACSDKQIDFCMEEPIYQ